MPERSAERSVRHEEIDDHPIEYYKLKFLAGMGTILDKDWAVQHCRIGSLPIFIVAGRVKWRPEVDKDGDLYKLVQVCPEPDMVVPVPRELREQALRFLANNGNAVLDIPDEDQDAEAAFLGEIAVRDIDRLKAFLGANFAEDILSSDDDDPVAIAISLLRQQLEAHDGDADDEDLAVALEDAGGYEDEELEDDEEEIVEEEEVAPAPERNNVEPIRSDPSGPIFDEPPEGYEGHTFSRAM